MEVFTKLNSIESFLRFYAHVLDDKLNIPKKGEETSSFCFFFHFLLIRLFHFFYG